jgi:anthranilate phosphoribosyltransferase
MIRESIDQLVNQRDLTLEQAAQVMEEIMTGEATPAQLGAFLTALRVKGETVDEVAGMAQVMRAKANQVKYPGPLTDVVGTGGDVAGTFNFSTAAAFVLAGAGVKVAKHGNRAISSQAGAGDVLEALGVKLELTPEQVAQCIGEVGIGFMFAPAFHPAMRFAAGPRREIGIRTVFNILGPLTNPASATHELCGVAVEPLAPKMAGVLQRLGATHVLVVRGADGLDEISLCAPTQVWELKAGAITEYTVTPEEFGFQRVGLAAIKGGTGQDNAATMRRLFQGEPGPIRDMTLLNAGAAFVAADRTATIKDGIALAAETVVSGEPLRCIEKLAQLSSSFGA